MKNNKKIGIIVVIAILISIAIVIGFKNNKTKEKIKEQEQNDNVILQTMPDYSDDIKIIYEDEEEIKEDFILE